MNAATITATATAKRARWSLRQRLVAGMIGYTVLLTLGVLANDFIVNESAENLVWSSLLQAELDHLLSRRQTDPGFQLANTQTLELFELREGDAGRPDFRALAPGIHDDVPVDGRKRVLLVRDTARGRLVLALDISDMENREARIRGTVFLCAFVSVVLLCLLGAWGAARLTRPLRALAAQIRSLRPEAGAQRVVLPDHASSELAVIVDEMNGHARRLEAFIEREREFVATASHELRTPLSAIQGAVELTLGEDDLPRTAELRLRGVQDTIADVREMITVLLALAKNPERLAEFDEPVALHLLIPELVDRLAPLARRKELTLAIGPLIESTVVVPLQMAQSAVGNLVRNAIENASGGTVLVRMDAPAAVVIENPARSPDLEELARIYTRLARGGGRDGGGIGLALITRLCGHCGWTLTLTTGAETGVHFRIDFSTAPDRAAPRRLQIHGPGIDRPIDPMEE